MVSHLCETFFAIPPTRPENDIRAIFRIGMVFAILIGMYTLRNKIGIIGAGQVGSELANELMRSDSIDCVLVDIRETVARGKALDLAQCAPFRQSSATITGGDDFSALRGCSIVVITAGTPRKPGMSRDDLLGSNLRIVAGVCSQCIRYAPDAVWIMVTNPLDAMTYAAWKLSNKAPHTIIGMAGALDTARFRSIIARKSDVSPDVVQAMVIGSHGDLMVPLTRFATIAGIPAIGLLGEKSMRDIVRETTNAGNELVSLLQSGSAYYAAGSAIASMVDAIMHDKKKVICSSVLCRKEYGLNGVFIGVPVFLGAGGAGQIVELGLNIEEQDAFNKTADHLRNMQQAVDKLLGFSGEPAS
jgi:malate dehydrogenase